MSHFITPPCLVSPPEPLLNQMALNIIIPHAQVSCLMRRGSKNSQWTREQRQRQTLLLKKICSKLKEDQIQRNRMENDEKMIEEYHKLKQRMRNDINSRSKLSVQRIMKPKPRDNRIDMAAMNKQRPKNIDLFRKHRSKIVVQLESYNQASQILEDKEKYIKWYNSSKNSPVNSPMFSKMTYLMQKINLRQLKIKSKEQESASLSKENAILSVSSAKQEQNSNNLKKLFQNGRNKENHQINSGHAARMTANMEGRNSVGEGYSRIKREKIKTGGKLIDL